MFPSLLALHSFLRWFILVAIMYSLFLGYRGWIKDKSFTRHDHWVRVITVTFVHIQLILGIGLYYLSPIVDYFLKNFSESVGHRELRFFGMEHITMMLLGITLVTIGSSRARRKKTDREKFKTIAIWYSIAFVIIFCSIPWGFSPFTSRPYYRVF